MINESVINEIYKKFNKPHKNVADLRLDYFLTLLNEHHTIESDGFEIVLKDVEEFSPFRRFLIRGLYAVLEFDRNVAFVFQNHILFFSKKDSQMSVHFAPAKEQSIWDKIFGK